MNIEHIRIGQLRVVVSLRESEYFDITYDGFNRSQRGKALVVVSFSVIVGLEDGEITVSASGYLRRKDGSVGSIYTNEYLTGDKIPAALREIIEVEYAEARAKIARQTPIFEA